jgi:flagellar basal body P-ring formation protein FlgA
MEPAMNPPFSLLSALFAALALLAGSAHGQTQRQDTAALKQVVEQYLRVQTSGLPGQVNITVGQIDARTNLSPCPSPEAFLPGSSRVWGKTTVGIRCTAPSPWTIYVGASVQVFGEYIATAAPLAQGQVIGPNDLVRIKGDLTALPNGIITDTSQAIGRTVTASLAAGMPLRTDTLRAQQAVQQGQTIRIVSNGPGFQVSTEAKALTNAAEGQVAQARTASGQVVSGIARTGGVVEVTY